MLLDLLPQYQLQQVVVLEGEVAEEFIVGVDGFTFLPIQILIGEVAEDFVVGVDALAGVAVKITIPPSQGHLAKVKSRKRLFRVPSSGRTYVVVSPDRKGRVPSDGPN